MKVAVTGAGGFIGRHVLDALAAHPVESIAVLRPGSGEEPALPCTHIVALDILDTPPDAFERMGRPDLLIHLAWGGLPNYRSLHHFERELPGHYRFLQSLVRSGLDTLLVSGTCFEYGMRSGPLAEALEPRACTPYGFAKDCLRRQLDYLRATHPFNLTWARLFYLYGEGQAANALYSQLAAAVAHGERYFEMSGGEQLRDYLPVEEAAERLVSLALARRDTGVINICSGEPVSVRGLVEGWIRRNGWRIEPSLGHYPYPTHEPMAFWGDNTKLQAFLAATPSPGITTPRNGKS